jgi:uncharacterized protein YkwD
MTGLTRSTLLALALCGLAACNTPEKPQATPSFYARLDEGGRLDGSDAVAMINAYRARNGLPPLALDEALSAQARRRAATVADTDTSTWGEVPTIARASTAAGRLERVSAGYRTMAEAFSGWRDSPPHNRVLLAPDARRIGIAAVDRPGTKYRVYWDIVVER